MSLLHVRWNKFKLPQIASFTKCYLGGPLINNALQVTSYNTSCFLKNYTLRPMFDHGFMSLLEA